MQKTVCDFLGRLSWKQCRSKHKDPSEEKVCHNICNNTSLEALKAYHAVTVKELTQGNSTRKIVEMIFKSSWVTPVMKDVNFERVLKINHREDILWKFEEYRETVKRRACKTCSRCMADGNEVLRFHGTTSMCSLNVLNGVIKVCSVEGCHVCEILRTVFYYKSRGSLRGIYTTSTSGLAHDSTHLHGHNKSDSTISVKRVMLLCRVIAGHVHKPLNSHESFWKVSSESGNDYKIREVFLSDHRAFLPCFLIVYSL
ncbi:hypothetical protein SUGI_0962980 [Cryptomeria japonica]|uniref:uncharacterized protein LOC131042819 n=1 Tax=Cryptomeria japonica TaxID=3369 RepID=UPI0024147944|nr:uncharacterized protein LOC131042819 [Cryptomeria japonica]GLJ45761.1 hypothetical protein SUGI_0962980 [Cryptomeria japonica]